MERVDLWGLNETWATSKASQRLGGFYRRRGLRDALPAQYERTIVPSLDSWDDAYEDIVITGGDGRTVEYVDAVVWFQPAEEMG